MAEHLSEHSLERYRQRTLSPGEVLRADDHLAACETCRTRAGDGGQPDQLLRTFDASLRAEALSAERKHLSYEQIASLVDDGLDRADREIAESHLEFCRLCTDEVGDLRAYRASLTDAPAEQNVLATGAPPFTAKLAAFWRLFAFPSPLRLAAALALLVVSLTAALWWMQKRAPQEVALTVPPVTEEPPKVPEVAPAPIVVALDDGGVAVTLDALGSIKGLESLEPTAQLAVKDALTSGRAAKPDALAGLSGKSGTLMGGSQDSTFALLGPVGIVIRADRPRMSWRPLAGASEYTVSILDSDLRIVAASPPISATTWTPQRALERGRDYSWQVAAVKDDQRIIAPAATAPEARFRVIDQSTSDELRRLENTKTRSHLARGVLYAQAGLLEDAERELRALVRANPKSEVARKLLDSVRRR